MHRAVAIVLGVVACWHAAPCSAVLYTFTATNAALASPDANGSVDVWTTTPGGNNSQHGNFLTNSNFNGNFSNNGSAGAGTSAWVFYAGNGNTSFGDAAIAPLAGRNLSLAGDFIAIDYDNGFFQDSAGGRESGISLFDGANNHQFTFRLQNTDSTYEIVDAGGVHNTGIAATDNGVRLTLTLLNGGGGYALNVFNTQSPGPINTTIVPRVLQQNTSTIASIRIFNNNTGLQQAYDVFFNNLAINAVPEASGALAVPLAAMISGAAVWTGRRLRRGRHLAA